MQARDEKIGRRNFENYRYISTGHIPKGSLRGRTPLFGGSLSGY